MADLYVQQADANAGNSPDDGVTLAQALLLEQDYLKRGVLEIFVAENPILQNLPFMDIEGNSLMYNYEVSLPGVGFRAVNAGYEATHGLTGRRSVGLAIFGGDLDVDRFIIKTKSSVNNQRAIQEGMQVKAMSKTFAKHFFDGDRDTSSEEEFDGVNILLEDSFHTAGGAAKREMVSSPDPDAGWYALDDAGLVDAFDEALDDVVGGSRSKVILANKATRRWLTKIAREDGQITINRNEFGFQVFEYAGVPILEIEDDALGNDILDFDEDHGGNSTDGPDTTEACSFYVARFESNYVQGLQNGGMDVRDLGELDSAPLWRTRVEWFCALALMHPRALKRVTGLVGYEAPA